MEFSEIFLLLILVSREVRASVGEAHVCEASQMIGSVSPEENGVTTSRRQISVELCFPG